MQHPEAAATASRDRLPRALRPFRTGQYRLLAVALALSLFGAGVWLIAVVFQIKGAGGGPVEVSIVATANAVGLLLAVLVGGAVADRVPQKLILLTVEITKGVLVTAVAVLAFTGGLEVWQLAVVGFVLGAADGFFMPAYSAMLPSILPEQQLLAANGFEGMLRPAILQAGGPAVAAGLIAALSPAAAFAIIAVTQAAAVCCLVLLRRTAVRRELAPRRHPLVELGADVRDGFRYLVRTPWLLTTLLFSSLLVLMVVGPMQVLLPFAVTERTGTDAGGYALVLVAFGVGGAVASIAMGSLRLPRRYLTVMTLMWGLGCLPFAIVAVATQLWLMAVAAALVGVAVSAASVIWGTLLQRRVPRLEPRLLRVARAAAGVDGDRRAARRGGGLRPGVPRGGACARGARRRGDRGGADAARRARASARRRPPQLISCSPPSAPTSRPPATASTGSTRCGGQRPRRRCSAATGCRRSGRSRHPLRPRPCSPGPSCWARPWMPPSSPLPCPRSGSTAPSRSASWSGAPTACAPSSTCAPTPSSTRTARGSGAALRAGRSRFQCG